MKKLLISAALLVLAAPFVSQAATTGTLQLNGIVPEVLSITVTPEAVAANLDLETNQSNLKVGTVHEQSNLGGGYRVTVSSSNDGALKRAGGTETIPYIFAYGGTAVSLANSSTTPAIATNFSSATIGNSARDVSISYAGTPAEQLISGQYQDTLIFEISAN